MNEHTGINVAIMERDRCWNSVKVHRTQSHCRFDIAQNSKRLNSIELSVVHKMRARANFRKKMNKNRCQMCTIQVWIRSVQMYGHIIHYHSSEHEWYKFQWKLNELMADCWVTALQIANDNDFTHTDATSLQSLLNWLVCVDTSIDRCDRIFR